MWVEGDLLHAIANLCFAPKPLCSIFAGDRATFWGTILPTKYLPAKYDTTLERTAKKKHANGGAHRNLGPWLQNSSRHRIGY